MCGLFRGLIKVIITLIGTRQELAVHKLCLGLILQSFWFVLNGVIENLYDNQFPFGNQFKSIAIEHIGMAGISK
jgi:hypothetical protein